jgi:sortase A
MVLFVIGSVLVTVWALALGHRTVVGDAERRAVLAQLEAPRATALADPRGAVVEDPAEGGLPLARSPDTSEWAVDRVAAFVESLSSDASSATPLAVLEIPRLDLSVLVLDGIDEWSLNRGVGRIPGTADPAGIGNVGIAGHRDGYFRALRGIAPGEIIEWRGPDGLRRYEVDWTRIVSPEDVEVLAATDHDALTLVTCHPFFFAGPAPDRFIVRARRIDSGRPPAQAAEVPGSVAAR